MEALAKVRRVDEAEPRRRRRYVSTYDHYSAEALRHANEVLDRLLAEQQGLKPFEGRCPGCGKVISSRAPNCGRGWCAAVYPKWSKDQRRVTAVALREYGGLLLLTDVTLPGTPEQERHRRKVAIPGELIGAASRRPSTRPTGASSGGCAGSSARPTTLPARCCGRRLRVRPVGVRSVTPAVFRRYSLVRRNRRRSATRPPSSQRP